MKLSKRIPAVICCVVMIISLMLAITGCSGKDWRGEWNRTGDATFSRAILEIYDVKGSGFSFEMTLYNGNVAGRLEALFAEFTSASRDEARYSVPDTSAYIDFTLNEDGSMEVYFGNELLSEDSVGRIESEVFGFKAPAFITGHFERGGAEYLNSNLYKAGVLTEEEDKHIQRLVPEDTFIRLLDCFQSFSVGDMENSGSHDDQIGAYVYYGSNTMQTYAAMIIIYDDGTAGAVISKEDGALVYYSDNSIYKDASLTPQPVQHWMDRFNEEREGI